MKAMPEKFRSLVKCIGLIKLLLMKHYTGDLFRPGGCKTRTAISCGKIQLIMIAETILVTNGCKS